MTVIGRTFFTVLISLLSLAAAAQETSLKTNLVADATASFSLGAEVRLGEKFSIEVPLSYNPFSFRDKQRKWKHFLVQPEFRRWIGERALEGHFFGAHLHYGNYNVGGLPNGPFSVNMSRYRYQGWLAGAGVSYGYRWNFTPRWGLEATIGVGYVYLDYKKYECETCGAYIREGTRHYFGPTKLGVSLILGLGK